MKKQFQVIVSNPGHSVPFLFEDEKMAREMFDFFCKYNNNQVRFQTVIEDEVWNNPAFNQEAWDASNNAYNAWKNDGAGR